MLRAGSPGLFEAKSGCYCERPPAFQVSYIVQGPNAQEPARAAPLGSWCANYIRTEYIVRDSWLLRSVHHTINRTLARFAFIVLAVLHWPA